MRDATAGVSQEGIDTVDEVGGTALRLLHQLSASLPAAEAISRSVASSQYDNELPSRWFIHLPEPKRCLAR